MLNSPQNVAAQIKAQMRCVSIEQALDEVAENNGLIVDVREAAESAQFCNRRAVAIPRGVLEMQLPKICDDHARPIYVHCASSVRAAFAAEQLQRLGYQNLNIIECGIDDILTACNLEKS